MAIKLKESKSKIETKSKSNYNTVEFLFFLALNILVIPFSAYQTYIGYEKDVAGNAILAIVIALISAVLFAAMNFGIRQDRLQGKKHLLKVIMYVIPFGLSFFGNFNAFYSNQMKENLLREEVSDYKYALTQTRDLAIQKINGSIGLTKFEREYTQKLQALETEYKEAVPPSWGPKSQQKWQELVYFLAKEGGEIKVSDQGKNKKVYFRNATIFAKNTYDKLVKSKKGSVQQSIEYIDNKYNPLLKQIDSLTNLSKPVYKSSMLDNMVEVENQIRAKAESVLEDNKVFVNPALQPSKQNDIGTIKHTINSAFVKFENPSATIFSFFLSIIIDVAALIYILIFIPFNKASKNGGRLSSGPQRI
ncbi:hypothetical protein EVU94_13995 [Flavobacteriaceae bacterium 144Ye]|nr:hypothetical protein EVU94_13995 [Flavobacteriaceae bacterium 144Ye]